MDEVFLQGSLVSPEVPLRWSRVLSASTEAFLSQLSTGRRSGQCRVIFPLTAALQAGDGGARDLAAMCGLRMTNAALSPTHPAGPRSSLVQPPALAGICGGHWRREATGHRLLLGCGTVGCCLQGLLAPRDTPGSSSHLRCPLNISRSLLERLGEQDGSTAGSDHALEND